MEIILETITDMPEDFELPDGETITNFGHVLIVQGDPFAFNIS